MWSKPRSTNANLAVSNQYVASLQAEKFRELHLKKISSVKSRFGKNFLASSFSVENLRKGGKKAFRKKERQRKIKKNNAELKHKILMLGKGKKMTSPVSPPKIIRRKVLNRELNRRNRVIAKRLKEAHFHDYYMPRSSTPSQHKDSVSKTHSFAVRSAWGKQLRSAIHRSLTRRDLRGLKKSYRSDGSLPRSRRAKTAISTTTRRKKQQTSTAMTFGDTSVYRSRISMYGKSQDILLEARKKIRIQTVREIMVTSSRWSVYIFDVSSKTFSDDELSTKSSGIRMCFFKENEKVVLSSPSATQNVFLSNKMLSEMSNNDDDEDMKQLLLNSKGTPRFVTRLSERQNILDKFVLFLLSHLRLFRGQVLVKNSSAYERAMKYTSRLDEHISRDVNREISRRKKYREDREKEELRILERSTWTPNVSTRTVFLYDEGGQEVKKEEEEEVEKKIESTENEEKQEKEVCIYRGVVNIDGNRSLLRLRSKRNGQEVFAVATETCTGNQIEVKVSQHDASEIMKGNAISVLRGLLHF